MEEGCCNIVERSALLDRDALELGEYGSLKGSECGSSSSGRSGGDGGGSGRERARRRRGALCALALTALALAAACFAPSGAPVEERTKSDSTAAMAAAEDDVPASLLPPYTSVIFDPPYVTGDPTRDAELKQLYVKARMESRRQHCALKEHAGLVESQPERTHPGYTLVVPLACEPFLVDMDGRVVREWSLGDSAQSKEAVLTPDGTLLYMGATFGELFDNAEEWTALDYNSFVREISVDGEVVSECRIASEGRSGHHSFELLPNGNLLVVMYRRLPVEECFARGADPNGGRAQMSYNSSLGCRDDGIVEFRRVSARECVPVWEWWSMDHVVQDRDPAAGNYVESVADVPERLDVDYDKFEDVPELRMQSGAAPFAQMHMNSVAYNPDLGQILFASYLYSEAAVIEHGATSEESAGHSGGRYGRGGDLLWRYGNAAAYSFPGFTEQERRLGTVHGSAWVPSELEIGLTENGRNHVLLFNNGQFEPYRGVPVLSTVDEVEMPKGNLDGGYERVEPAERTASDDAFEGGFRSPPAWRDNPHEINGTASFIFGNAQRLPNRNTLACYGYSLTVREVDVEDNVVWELGVPYESDSLEDTSDLPSVCGSSTCYHQFSYWRAFRYAPDSREIKNLLKH